MISIKTNLIKSLINCKTFQSFRYLAKSAKNDLMLRGLQSILGESYVFTAQTVREQHGKDEGFYPSIPPDFVVFPKNAQAVSDVHKLCYQNDVPIIPFGAGTGVEGGVNAINGGVCINLSSMKEIIEVNREDFDCTVEAGLDWRSLNDCLRDSGLYFPVNPGASATIGGMASTCASGTNAVAFGTMKQNVINLEVVLPNGQIIHTSGTNCRSRKSSAGYDLTSLFVGSEGTLGTITKICLKLSAAPNKISVGVCSFPDDRSAIDSVIETLQLSIPVARVEYLDDVSIKACHTYSKVDLPHSPTLFLEFIGTTFEELHQREHAFHEIAKSNGGTHFEFSSDPKDRKRIWKARHELFYACKTLKPNSTFIGTDVCVPISRLTEIILLTKQLISSKGIIGPMFGHVGDGNFHTILLLDPNDQEEFARVRYVADKIGEIAIELCGTCTGEHGIGRGKVKLLKKQFDSSAIEMMKSLKSTFDPKNLMNPQKLFYEI